jgi:hypothetical protein
MPRDVSILALCEKWHAKIIDAFKTYLKDHGCDTSDTIDVTHDGSNEMAIISIFTQELTPSAVVLVVEAVSQLVVSGFCFVTCDTGCNGIDAVSRAAKGILNSYVDVDGSRVFNCQLFGMHNARGKEALNGILDDALRWVDAAWVTEPTPTMPHPSEVCRTRPKCYENYVLVEELAERFSYTRLCGDPTAFDAGEYEDDREPSTRTAHACN